MNYLITQMWLCLLLATLLGAVIGYWLAKCSSQKRLDELEADSSNKLDEQNHSNQIKEISKPPTEDIAKDTIAKARQTSYEVEEVEGIGKSYGAKLRDSGISTTQELLDKCSNMDGRIEIANHIGIEDFVIRKWASMSDLMRVDGIEGQFAELMVYAGIDSAQDLGQLEANALHKILVDSNAEQNRVKEIPDRNSLESMINEAKTLPVKMLDT